MKQASLTLQETLSDHDSMNIPKIEFISKPFQVYQMFPGLRQ